MEEPREEADTRRADQDAEAELEARLEETSDLVETGPRAGNRAGAFAFLALIVVIAGAVHFYLAENGSDSYIYRLDAELLNHAELTLAAMEDGNRMAVVPSWPLRFYSVLRRDVAIYAVLVALAAYVWGQSARARARRDAYLVHEKLSAEVAELRRRLDRLDDPAAPAAENNERKG